MIDVAGIPNIARPYTTSRVNARGIEPVQAGDIFYAREEGNALAAPWGGRAGPTQSLRLLFTGMRKA